MKHTPETLHIPVYRIACNYPSWYKPGTICRKRGIVHMLSVRSDWKSSEWLHVKKLFANCCFVSERVILPISYYHPVDKAFDFSKLRQFTLNDQNTTEDNLYFDNMVAYRHKRAKELVYEMPNF